MDENINGPKAIFHLVYPVNHFSNLCISCLSKAVTHTVQCRGSKGSGSMVSLSYEVNRLAYVSKDWTDELSSQQKAEWLKDLQGKPVFVAFPAAYDFMFIYWYLMRFAGESPSSFSALDMKNLAMAILGRDFRKIGKRID